jgi:hypothetical protein
MKQWRHWMLIVNTASVSCSGCSEIESLQYIKFYFTRGFCRPQKNYSASSNFILLPPSASVYILYIMKRFNITFSFWYLSPILTTMHQLNDIATIFKLQYTRSFYNEAYDNIHLLNF